MPVAAAIAAVTNLRSRAGADAAEGIGIDLHRSNAGHARTLPVPATYVIDREGTIRWAFVDTDYTARAEPADVLAALDALA